MENKRKIPLPNKFTEQLVNTPESGMGFHIVDIYLRNGDVLKKKVVLNCSLLAIESSINIDVNEIDKIEIE